MFLLDNNGITDPCKNLALEEYCLRRLNPDHEYLLFYINEPSVIVGKHQVPFREANCEYARQKGVSIIRRISGGGAVYHDRGNLNFSFITAYASQKLHYFKKLIQPILEGLHRLGVPAEITKNNSILVGGKKVSGTSQYTNMKRMLSHGTLLFDSDLTVLNSVLVSNPEVIQARGVKSIRSQVANIADHLSRPLTMEGFLQELASTISGSLGGLEAFRLTSRDWDCVQRLAEEKYNAWEWTFGRSPDFTVVHKFSSAAVNAYVTIGVTHGIIREIKIGGEQIVGGTIPGNIGSFIGKPYGPDFRNLLRKQN